MNSVYPPIQSYPSAPYPYVSPHCSHFIPHLCAYSPMQPIYILPMSSLLTDCMSTQNMASSIKFPSDPTRIIGGITAAERYIKIVKYLSKRRRRTNKKKIHYVCRKQVADQRIRVNGRFIKQQDAAMLLSCIGASPTQRINDINTIIRNSKEKNMVDLGRKRKKRIQKRSS